ncbi:hypothetical protein BC835DRAFT_1303732 [Cytidiella melzeri]|nr:hypothetical protein BC835DRAFT_1303732 [Cytidiella melzeri]
MVPYILVNTYFNTKFATSTGEPGYTNPGVIVHSKESGDNATLQQWYLIPVQYGTGTDQWCIVQNVSTGGYAYVDPTTLVSGAEIMENVVATLWTVNSFDGKSTLSPAGLPDLMETLYWGIEKDASGTTCTLRYGDKDAKNHWILVQ